MKNYFKYLLLLLLVIVPIKVLAAEVTDVYINEADQLTFTKSGDYNVYQVAIKYGEVAIYEWGQNAGGQSANLFEKIIEGCESTEACPHGYVGNYTLEIVALDTANEYAPVEDTRTTKTMEFKSAFSNGNTYYHADIVGNETKYTITLNPDNGIEPPMVLGSDFTFGQHVVLGTIESYGFTKLDHRYYLGFEKNDFYVIQSETISTYWEPLYTFNLDFNGGTWGGNPSRTYTSVSVGIGWSYDNLMIANDFHENEEDNISVIAPYAKELDHIEVNGETVTDNQEVNWIDALNNHDSEFNVVYIWRWLEGTIVHTITFTDGYDNVIGTVEVADGQPVARPNNPEMGRLIFSCWKVTNDCYDFDTPITQDLTIDAYWNFNFRVEANVEDAAIFTYNGHDYEDRIGSAGAYHENEIVGVDQRGINGYELVEWRLGSVDGPVIGNDENADYYIANGGHLKIKQKTTTSNLVFYAIYEKSTVTVNFNTNGGTAIAPQYVIPGEYATRPDIHASTRDGYILGDWYTDPELTHKFNFSTPIETDMTLYADWDIYLNEVRGTVGKPVAGFTSDTNIVSSDSSKYTFNNIYWYETTEPYPHIEGEATFEKDKEYEIRFYVVPADGYGVDSNTRFYINGEETSCFGAAEARQIRWVATDPTEVTNFNVGGIVTPVEGKTFDNSKIKLNTPGLNIVETFWTSEDTGEWLSESDKFVKGKKYVLHIGFDTKYGYILKDGFSEDDIVGAPTYLKAELFNNGDFLEMQIFYEAKAAPFNNPTLKYSAVNNKITLTWNHQDSAVRYEVYRSTDNKTFTKIATTTNDKYVNSGLTYGTTYYYKVKAFNSAGSYKFSNVISKRVIPYTVQNLKITSAYTTTINLSWDKVSTTGYQVYRSTDNKTWTKVATITSNSTLTYKDTGLTANTTYYYKVRAYKLVDGKYTYGNFSSVVSTKTAPKTPTASVSLWNYNTLSIKVNAVTGATKYLIYRSTSSTGTYTKVGELTAAGTFKNTGLTTGKTYYYKVKACNSYNRCSGYSSVVSMKVVPGKVKNLQSTPTSNSIKLTWNSVYGATGYEVYRSTSKTGTYTKLTTITNTTYTNKNLTSNKTYYYKVRAYRTVNGTKVYGAYSDILTTKTS